MMVSACFTLLLPARPFSWQPDTKKLWAVGSSSAPSFAPLAGTLMSGKVGVDLNTEEAYAAAELVGLNILSTLKGACLLHLAASWLLTTEPCGPAQPSWEIWTASSAL